jgi:hypothetical protein
MTKKIKSKVNDLQSMTVREYAKRMGCTKQAVFQRYYRNGTLPGVYAFDLIGNNYILLVNLNEIKKNLVDVRKPSKLAAVK